MGWGTILKMVLEGLNKAFKFVVVHWKEVTVACMACLILYQNFSAKQFFFGLDTIPSLHAQLEKKELELEQAKKNLDTCVAGNKKLEAAIDRQNDQIDMLGDLAKKFDEQFGLLGKKIDKMRKDTNQNVEDILNAPPPKTCEDAMRYLHEASKGGFLWK
jgi:septal ring factor EnvC (AmiA/AmiB activator)